MLDYMRALHQRFCREPERQDLQEQEEKLRHQLKEHLDRNGRAAFIAGFQLALGIANELTPYSFEDEEEQHAYQAALEKR